MGNFLITAHRLSAGGPLRDLPAVDRGDTVLVTVGEVEYTYEIVATRKTEDHAEGSFWSDAQGNPEHRIDKIGVLRKTSGASPAH